MSEWISVKDRLPRKKGEYLIFQPEQETMGTLKVDARRTVVKWTGKRWISSLGISHWQPLPDPPKEAA